MSVDFSYLLRKDEPRAGLRDLDDVVLLASARSLDGYPIPVGAEGTIVGVWQDGEAFEVEFSEPHEALATVPVAALKYVGRPAR